MPRKSVSPAAGILNYFETQPLEVSETVLALAITAVAKRKPAIAGKAKTPKTPRAARSTTAPAAPDVKPLGEK